MNPHRILIAIALFVSAHAHAATTIVDWTLSGAVPDNNPTGLADTRIITSPIASITNVDVRLEFSGGWNGDLYAYLTHSSGFSILLNRAGRTSLNPDGSGSSGFDITLSDNATTDIHTGIGSSGLITGSYQPDARNTDPATALDTDARTAFLSSFQNLNANGSWTLFVADNSAGDASTLTGWGMTITGSVPEPSRATLTLAACVIALLQRRRRA